MTILPLCEKLLLVPLDLFKLLNKEQAQAASQIEGPLLIIAGAGSGKTRMITYRIANMLNRGIKEEEILALTFTNKAAKEMRERIKEVTKKDLKKLTATTFHSFGLGLLKKYIHLLGYRNDFTLYDDNDNLSLVKNCIITKGYNLSDYSSQSLKNYFSQFKTGRLPLPVTSSAIREIYEEYLLTQKAYNVVDFDDLLILPLKILSSFPLILESVQQHYKYIMVDEFQDTSLLQYKLVSLIAKKDRNIAVVGDDDQSIYSWRGANYRNILSFEEDFPERKEFRLERNYRSSGNILNAANSLICHNKLRKDKKLWTESANGENITVKDHPNGEKEASFIAFEIRRLMREHRYNFSDFAILVRTNSLINGIETTLLENRIPVTISGATSFFDRKEIRDILCYLKAIQNENDDNSLLRIINTPRRGIGRKAIEKLREFASGDNISLYSALQKYSLSPIFNKKTQESLHLFNKLLYKWKTILDKPTLLIDTIIKDTHYISSIREEFPDNDKLVSFKINSISFLSERIDRYFKENPDKKLRDYLNNVSIIGKENNDDNNSSINLMTMHASKGLEFKVVFLAGIEDNIIPSKRALEEDENNIDEERRLFYVAITRAKEKLYINYARCRTDFEGKEKSALPSRFIGEIPTSLFNNDKKSPEELKKKDLEDGKKFLEMLAKLNKNK